MNGVGRNLEFIDEVLKQAIIRALTKYLLRQEIQVCECKLL